MSTKHYIVRLMNTNRINIVIVNLICSKFLKQAKFNGFTIMYSRTVRITQKFGRNYKSCSTENINTVNISYN